MHRILIFVVLAMAAFAIPGEGQDTPRSERPVGATTRRFVPQGRYNWRGATTHALVTTIWYPAAMDMVMLQRDIGPPDSPLFRLGEWADDPAVAVGQFPLIVLSHGTGGSAQIMAWLARALASQGYIVAAVNHPGNNALEEYTAEGFLVWWERARDLSTVIDFVLRDATLGRAIDRRRIGAAGFSLGGYTMFEIAGARTDPVLFQRFCRSVEAEGCVDPLEFPNLFARWAELESTSPAFRNTVGEAGRSYRDARVRAVFAIAPALGQALRPDSLRRIEIPIEIVAGQNDQIVPVRSNAQFLARLTRRATLTLLPGGVGQLKSIVKRSTGGHQISRCDSSIVGCAETILNVESLCRHLICCSRSGLGSPDPRRPRLCRARHFGRHSFGSGCNIRRTDAKGRKQRKKLMPSALAC